MLDLASAIKRCEEKAKELREQVDTHMVVDAEDIGDCIECAEEHEQLAAWLTELQGRREADRGIPVSERLPEEKINPKTNDFEEVLCSTFLGTVRVCKYGKPMGYSHAHFWDWGEIMDKYITAWQYKPESYKEGGKE